MFCLWKSIPSNFLMQKNYVNININKTFNFDKSTARNKNITFSSLYHILSNYCNDLHLITKNIAHLMIPQAIIRLCIILTIVFIAFIGFSAHCLVKVFWRSPKCFSAICFDWRARVLRCRYLCNVQHIGGSGGIFYPNYS